MLVDLHVHPEAAPRNSAGAPDWAALCERAAALGLAGVAVVGDGVLPDADPAAGKAFSVRLFRGVELDTDRGHYLVFLPKPAELPPMAELFGGPSDPPRAVRDVLARAAALGGAVVAAHPYDRTVEHPGGDIVYTLRGL